MNLQQHRTDKEAAEKGKWFSYDGARFLIAAHGTPKYQKAMMRRGKQNRAAVNRDDFDAINGMAVEVMADTVLLGWEGVMDGEKELPYSRANAVLLLTQAMEFRQWVESQAMNLANFVVEQEAADKAALKSGTDVAASVG